MAFYLAIERVAPQVWTDLRDLAAKRRAEGVQVSHRDVAAFLARWNLDPACKWLADDVLIETRTGPVGIPATGGSWPTHERVLCLSWEPGDTGEDRAAFLKRARATLDAYANEIEAWRRAAGIELPARERDRGGAPDGVHRWDLLVSRIVLRLSYAKIADEIGVTPQAAEKHVKALANRLQIALPKAST
jgi:hypothetical protein